MSYRLAKITQFKLEQVLKFTATHFSRHQTMLKHLAITPNAFSSAFNPVIQACYSSGFSYMAQCQSELASVILSMPYLEFKQVFSPLLLKTVKSDVAPIVSLLSQLNGSYKPENSQKTINHFIACTNEKFKGSRFLEKLIHEVQQEGCNKGFQQYIATSTSKITQKILKKLNYEQKQRIIYNKFAHEGKTPFIDLIDSDCAILMIRKFGRD